MERVQHATFGKGTVVGVRANGKLTIDFDSGTTKILLERAVAAVEGESKASIAKARRDAKTIRHRAAEATAERERGPGQGEREWLLRIAARDAEYEGRRAAGSVAACGATPARCGARATRQRGHCAAYRDRLLADGDPRAEVMTLGPPLRRATAADHPANGSTAPRGSRRSGGPSRRFASARGFLDRARELPAPLSTWSCSSIRCGAPRPSSSATVPMPPRSCSRIRGCARCAPRRYRPRPSPRSQRVPSLHLSKRRSAGASGGRSRGTGTLRLAISARRTGRRSCIVVRRLGVGALVNARAGDCAVPGRRSSPVAFGQSRALH